MGERRGERRSAAAARLLAAATVCLLALATFTPSATGNGLSGPHFVAGAGPVLPPDAAPFGVARRASLARSALLFPESDDDGHLEGGVYVLPVPLPWPPGLDSARNWEIDVPAGAPVFALAAVAPARRGFSGSAVVTVDGQVVPSSEGYVVRDVELPDDTGLREYAALAMVVSPPDPGRHTLTVTCDGCATRDGPWVSTVNRGPRTYVLNVSPQAPGNVPSAPRVPAGNLVLASVAGVASDVIPISAPLTPAPPLTPPDGQRHGIVLDRALYSESLHLELPYRVYLPPGYFDGDPASPRRYPVVYLLHGLGASYRQWTNLGFVDEVERQLGGGSGGFIAVMPGGRSGYWVNHADGGPRWGDYVAKDLVAHVDATYNTIAQRGARAIGGISMGGHGALQNALNNPEVFGVAGGHSPGLRTRDQAPAFLGGYFMGTTAAASPGPDAYALRDPISLVRRSTPAAPPVLWIDMGQRDGFFPRATELHQALLDRGWAHTWSPAPGDHDGGYWRRRMPDYVGFYRAALAEFGA